METLQSGGNRNAGLMTDKIAELSPWFHNLHLPDGTETAPDHPLGDFPNMLWEPLSAALPRDMDGWTALDIGCNAGFYSFELAKRGCQVLGIDTDSRYLEQARWARTHFDLEDAVEFENRQVYDLAFSDRSFDIVLFMGVFYHLRYPLLAMDAVTRLVDEMLVFQSLSVPGEEVIENTDGLGIHERDQLQADGWPKMAFIEYRMAGDPTNWWLPNHACNQALLRQAGMEIIERPGDETYVCRPTEAQDAAWQNIRREFFAATGQN